MSGPPLHIVGAGGIGCAVGYAFCSAGWPVTFIDADPDKVFWGRENGVCVDVRPALPAQFLHFADWTPNSDSVVLLCTKCYDNAVVLDRLVQAKGGLMPPVIPIQNGFDRNLEARCEGLEGIASFVSECCPKRTHTRITRKGRLHLGYHSHKQNGTDQQPGSNNKQDRLPLLASCFLPLASRLNRCAPFRLTLVPDILPYKYTKLMYNAAISPLAAAAGLDNGQLLSVPRARRLFFALLKENYAILHQAGVPLGKIGLFHPDTVSRILAKPRIAHALAWAFYPSLRGTYCSMAGDLHAGRTEIDYYNLRLIELAGSQPCPMNLGVYRLIKQMERERLPAGLDRLDKLLDEHAKHC